jgi:serine/threonine-protein kinase ULK4
MIDGDGKLKLSDFGFAKLEGEDLEVIFQETFETTSAQWSQTASSAKPPKVYKKPFGDLAYIAPEILMGGDNTKESDLWSFGCILYQMYSGNLPFVSEDPEHLRNMILNKELPNPKGNKLSVKPSNDFLNLLKGLLEKDPRKRFNWKQVLGHPFWENKLKHLLPTKSIIVDGKEQLVDDEEANEDEDRVNTLNFSRMSTQERPRTGVAGSTIIDTKPEINVSFSIRY